MENPEDFVLVANEDRKMTPFKIDPDYYYFGELPKLLDLLPWSTPILFGMNLIRIPNRLFI